MELFLDRKVKRPDIGKSTLAGICLYLVLYLTSPIFGGGISLVFANGDHSDGLVKETEEVFNPLAFAIVSAGIVVVGYFMYRIFSGRGKKENGGPD
ncbi:MAG: hypothetical protein V3W19_12035 [Desulfatiglandales bacterium]